MIFRNYHSFVLNCQGFTLKKTISLGYNINLYATGKYIGTFSVMDIKTNYIVSVKSMLCVLKSLATKQPDSLIVSPICRPQLFTTAKTLFIVAHINSREAFTC